MLMSVIATDYNRVVCIRQTRNDEEVTDWWKWWAIIFLFKKTKQEKENYRVHLQRKGAREKNPKKDKEKEKMPQDESTVTAPGLRTPLPPSIWKETKCDARVGERDGLGWGGRNDSGLDGWWWMKQWHFSSGASVCECVWYTLAVCVCVSGGEVWCHAAGFCRVRVFSSIWPLTCLLCLVQLIYNDHLR